MNEMLKNKNNGSKKVLWIISILVIVILISLNVLSSNISLPVFKFGNTVNNANETDTYVNETNIEQNNSSVNNESLINDSKEQQNSNNDQLIKQYRIRIKSNTTINIRSDHSLDSQKVGTVSSGEVYDVYDSTFVDGYSWHKIGINMWIADDGTWTEKVSDDYVEIPITFSNTYVGNTVYFGEYEQNNNFSDGNEEIEWIILDNDGSKMLLLSKYALDSKIYNNSFSTWQDSSIREWLNNYFYNTAFTDQQKCYIKNVTNSTEYNNESPTKDNVFLLSATEVEKYYPNEYDRICYATQFSFASGTENFDGKCRWWLRSLNGDEQKALTVRTSEGRINYVTPVNSTGYGVRPAIWVDIK